MATRKTRPGETGARLCRGGQLSQDRADLPLRSHRDSCHEQRTREPVSPVLVASLHRQSGTGTPVGNALPTRIAAVVALAAVAALMGSCLADLDPPRACPPASKHPGGNCLPGLISPALGCLPPDALECLTGPRKSCTCQSDECPADPDGCYPADDCPEIVTDQHPGATCKTLAAEDIGEGLPSEVQCLCGCGGCAARCDGVGPVLGVVTGDMQASYPPIVRIDKYIPDRGTIGLYVRLRGLTNAGVLVCNTDDCNPPLAQYYLVTPLTTEFVEQILFDDPFVGQAAYSWDKPEDKPQFLAILPVYGTKTEPVPTLFEMDCIVPFVLPH